MSADFRFLLLLGVMASLGGAFLVIENRAMKRLRAHRIPRKMPKRAWEGILTWQLRAYDPASYDEEGKRILRRLGSQLLVLFGTWAVTAFAFVMVNG